MKIEILKGLVREAGHIGLSYSGRFDSKVKDDLSPVTEADTLIQEFLHNRLKSIFPDYKIVGEEKVTRGDEFSKSDYLWVIDPIDGTDAFREGLPMWGISIGLVHNYVPVLGLFYMPAMDKMFYCDENNIAYENGRVMRRPDSYRSKNIYVTSDIHHYYDVTYKGKLRSLGSTVAHLCFLARGAGAGAVLRGFLWDFAAGIAILNATGGCMMNFDGSPFDFESFIKSDGRSEFLIASPDKTFPDFVSSFKLRS